MTNSENHTKKFQLLVLFNPNLKTGNNTAQ